MTEALQIIRNEHRNIAQALACLDIATRDLRASDTKPDLELLFTVVYYMRLFPGRLHHPKEEHYLFAALSQRDPPRPRKPSTTCCASTKPEKTPWPPSNTP